MSGNYETFRDCVSEPIIKRLAPPQPPVKSRKSGRQNATTVQSPKVDDPVVQSDAEELGEFIEYLATEIFTSLPQDLQDLSYSTIQSNTLIREKYQDPTPGTLESVISILPPTVSETLLAYNLMDDESSININFLRPILTSYITTAASPPPPWRKTRTSACEICERDWIPLSYHHLIPRSTHPKVLKKGWHEEWMLNSVAWLCRACHNFVHGCASNEELAKEWFTIERLLQREDILRWRTWIARVRWKAR